MSTIQEIRAFEMAICDEVNFHIDNNSEVAENDYLEIAPETLEVAIVEGYGKDRYQVQSLIRDGEADPEEVADIAAKYIFLD